MSKCFVSLIFSAFLVFFLSACSCGNDGDHGGEFVGTVGANQERLLVLEPNDGSRFNAGEEFLLMLQAENFQLTDPNDNSNPGNGHYRAYLNGNDGDNFFTKSAEQNLVFNIPESLETGVHTIRFEVLDQSGNPTGAETVFSFNVN